MDAGTPNLAATVDTALARFLTARISSLRSEGSRIASLGARAWPSHVGFTQRLHCNATYGTGVARSKSPLGPFVKRSRPILASNATWVGPGHNSVVRTGGRAWMVYHAWSGAHDCGDDGVRELMLDPITWSGGWPTVGNGTPSRGTVVAPVIP